MDIIFQEGKKLYLKEKSKDPITLFEQIQGNKLHPYQKFMLKQALDIDEKPYNIYGDDFKIEINPCNLNGDCSLKFYDYDENQKLECDISVGFNKQELGEFIRILTDMHSQME